MSARIAKALTVVLTAALLLLARSASGQAADVLFDQGRVLMDEKKFEEAAEKLEQSNRLEPAPGTLLNLGKCYLALGRTASAWSAFRGAAALSAAAGQAKRERFAQAKADALKPGLSTLTVEVPPEARLEGLSITRDGDVVAPALYGQAVPVDPGGFTVVAAAPGKSEWRTEITVGGDGASESVTIPTLTDAPSDDPAPGPSTVAPVARSDAPAPAASSSAPVPERPPGDSDYATQRTLGLIAGAIGVVGFGTSLYLYLDAQSTIDDANCPDLECVEGVGDPDLHEEGRAQETRSLIVGGIGMALVGTGAVLLLTASPSESVTVSAGPSIGGAAVRVRATF